MADEPPAEPPSAEPLKDDRADYWLVEGTTSSQCFYCRHQRVEEGVTVCAAFPSGVPMGILFNGHDHREPYPGDGGVRYERAQWAQEDGRGAAYEEAPALERLLIEQVVLCWLHFHRIQQRYASYTDGSYTMDEAEHLEKRVNAAQRRYLRAVKTLARVRKMAGREPLQINIAEKQINMG